MGQDRISRNLYGSHPPHAQSWTDQPLDSRRYAEPQHVRRPMTVEKALREHCHIPARQYFLAVLDDTGNPITFTNQKEVPNTGFFDLENFRRSYEPFMGAPAPSFDEPSFGFEQGMLPLGVAPIKRWGPERRHGPSSGYFEDERLRRPPKRSRSDMLRREDEIISREMPAVVISPQKTLEVADEEGLRAFYEQRLKDLQQTACKLIAKAWIKAIEPKKQSTHPYTGQDQKAPEWWPGKCGIGGKDEKVRHKEPDHLYKRERVHLLYHMLKMVIEPNERQHPAIQKLNLNVARLEEVTNEALSSFFADKETRANAKKKPYLRELFKVARQDERYRSGGIDGDTQIHVMSDDRVTDAYMSEEDSPPTSPPDEQLERASMHSAIEESNSRSDSNAVQLPGSHYVGDASGRDTHYQNQSMPAHDLPSEQNHYLDGPAIPAQAPGHQSAVHQPGPIPLEMYSGHDSSRRSSQAFVTSEFNSPATSMYHGWQTTTPANPSSYAYAAPPSNYLGQPNIPMPSAQQFLHSSYESLPRHGHGYDDLPRSGHSHVGGVFRSTAVPPTPLSPTTFPPFVDSRILPAKTEAPYKAALA